MTQAQVFACVAAILVFLAGLLPVIHYLFYGLNERKAEILSYFDKRSVELYFKQFCLAEAPVTDFKQAFRDIYTQRFGIRTFYLAILLYAISLALAAWVATCSALGTEVGWFAPKMESRGVYALAGAYLWVMWDLITRFRQRDIVPSVLYWHTFRFIISIPLAYAMSTLLTDAAAPPIAFALGAFPTSTLMLILRRQAAQKFGLADDTTSNKLELEELQGVNTTLAEKFSEVGIMTVLQLAYEDPIQLTMRTNLSFNFVTDIISQSLATIYGLKLNLTRPLSVRGGMEAAELYEDLSSKNAGMQKRARDAVAKIAEAQGVTEPIIERILHDVRADPYTDFLRNIWR